MDISVSIINNPFDKELRFSCKQITLNSEQDGEIVVLPEHCNMLLTLKKAQIKAILTDNTEKNIEMTSSSVAKFENNNLTIFGCYKL